LLRQLCVRDLAIVEQVEIELQEGLTVLTGETGAGKSILVDAVELALGARASADQVRPGAARLEVVATFDLETAGGGARERLEEAGLGTAEAECIVRRVVGRDGRSRAWINATPVPLQLLRELAGTLVEIHGQHAHQALLARRGQREILDAYAGNAAELDELAALCARHQALESELAALAEGGAERTRGELLRYQLGELDELAPQPGEAEALEAEQRLLSRIDELRGGIAAAIAAAGEDGAQERLGLALRSLGPALDAAAPGVAEAHALLESALIEAREAEASLRAQLDRLEGDPQRLAEVERRLSRLHDVARKHGVSVHGLPELHQRLRAEVADDAGREQRRAALEDERSALLEAYRERCAALHRRRREAAEALAREVGERMQRLGMRGGRFEVEVRPEDPARPRPSGADRIEFRVAANPGQPPRALARVASGGELSRISLAVETLDRRAQAAPTAIFDEVDAGVGGRVADAVGLELRRLAAQRQVLCVTHLPQVASRAHQHLRVTKIEADGQARATVEALDRCGRIEELARMLAGTRVTERTRASARELLESS